MSTKITQQIMDAAQSLYTIHHRFDQTHIHTRGISILLHITRRGGDTSEIDDWDANNFKSSLLPLTREKLLKKHTTASTCGGKPRIHYTLTDIGLDYITFMTGYSKFNPIAP